MNYRKQIYQDLLKIKAQDEWEKDRRSPAFWVGALAFVTIILAVSFMML